MMDDFEVEWDAKTNSVAAFHYPGRPAEVMPGRKSARKPSKRKVVRKLPHPKADRLSSDALGPFRLTPQDDGTVLQEFPPLNAESLRASLITEIQDNLERALLLSVEEMERDFWAIQPDPERKKRHLRLQGVAGMKITQVMDADFDDLFDIDTSVEV